MRILAVAQIVFELQERTIIVSVDATTLFINVEYSSSVYRKFLDNQFVLHYAAFRGRDRLSVDCSACLASMLVGLEGELGLTGL